MANNWAEKCSFVMRWEVHFHVTTNLVNHIEMITKLGGGHAGRITARALRHSRSCSLWESLSQRPYSSGWFWFDIFSLRFDLIKDQSVSPERDGGRPTIANSVCSRDGQGAPGSRDDGHLLGRRDVGHLQEDDLRQSCQCCRHSEGALQLCRVSLKHKFCPIGPEFWSLHLGEGSITPVTDIVPRGHHGRHFPKKLTERGVLPPPLTDGRFQKA